MRTVGFLHTSARHVSLFDGLLADAGPGATAVHVVDEALLADAQGGSPGQPLQARLLDRLQELAGHAPDVIVCTCSTFGGHAERLTAQVGTPVVRVDRPLAERAVAGGGRVAVVAAVASTLGPTRELFEACAAACGSGAVIVDAPCLDAWALFEAGDHAGYLAHVARHVRSLAGDADVVVLAQASMAGAEPLLADLAIPVLSSPRLAVERAVEIAAGH